MPENMNASVKAQLAKYLPDALRKVLEVHEKVARQDMTITDTNDCDNVNHSATMKATFEQQKAAKSVVVHVEELLKLARLILQDEIIQDGPKETKEELIEMVQEAQARVEENRLEEMDNNDA